MTLTIPWPLAVYLVMSVLTFELYHLDKTKAIKGRWRISETTLHLCELFGGWPGALLAQRIFRHKNRKLRYALVLWGIITIHLAFWIWWTGLVRP